MSADQAPAGAGITDDEYVSRTGQKQANVPVESDSSHVETEFADRATADSDAQLQKDEKDAIDQSNVIESRTRGAAQPSGTYTEPGDEEGMPPASDGTSSGAQ